jgi:hypothetical protein
VAPKPVILLFTRVAAFPLRPRGRTIRSKSGVEAMHTTIGPVRIFLTLRLFDHLDHAVEIQR